MYSASYSSIIIPIFIESLGALHVEKLGYWTNMQTKKISFNMAWREKNTFEMLVYSKQYTFQVLLMLLGMIHSWLRW